MKADLSASCSMICLVVFVGGLSGCCILPSSFEIVARVLFVLACVAALALRRGVDFFTFGIFPVTLSGFLEFENF